MAAGTEDLLIVAARHVVEGEAVVTRQRNTIAKLAAAGHPTAQAERTLDLFLSTLAIFIDHERALRAERNR